MRAEWPRWPLPPHVLECSPVRLALARRGCVSGGRAFKNRLLTRALPAFASGFQQPGAGPCFLALPRGGRASASPRSRVSGVPWPWVSSGQAFPPRFVLVSCSQVAVGNKLPTCGNCQPRLSWCARGFDSVRSRQMRSARATPRGSPSRLWKTRWGGHLFSPWGF